MKNAKGESWSMGKKIRKFILKIFIIVMLIVTIGVAFKLMNFNQMDILFISDKLDGLRNDSQDIEKTIPDTDTDGFTYFRSSSENIAHDLDEGVTFINNEILITLKSEDKRKELEDYLLFKGGKIVGEIPELSEYQILLDTEYTYSELMELSNSLQSFDWVSDASINYAAKIDTSYYPDDKKWKNKWESIPSGSNWGMEAIDAPGAWEYRDKLEYVNIGIFDDMFDVNHEDLNFSEAPLGNAMAMSEINKGDLEWSSHGTHTSGTIAALFNNQTGVAGVSIKTNLYGVSVRGMEVADYSTSQVWKIALYYLIAKKQCSVINISLGCDQMTFEASRGEPVAIKKLQNMSLDIQKTLKSLIEHDYQFVICKSAGNQNEVNGDYKYFRKDEGDNNTEWSYYSYTEYEKYLDGDKANEKQFEGYKNRKKEIEGRLESGNVDAKYDILGAIEDEEVKKRIIMVGAAENLGTHNEGGFFGIGGQEVHDGYQIAAFSQCGKRVDVIAPGVDIYSTVKNGYSNKKGTSMAAPHVAGIAGLAFSANGDIKGDAVKKIICDTAVGEYGDDKYGLVNAKNVVEAALNYEEEEEIEQSDEIDVPQYTAVALSEKPLSEIVDIMGGDFEVGYDGDKLVYYTSPSVHIYNYDVLPGFVFYIDGASEDYQHGQDIKENIKSGKYDNYTFIALLDDANLTDTICANMTYNELSNLIGEFDCGGLAGANNYCYYTDTVGERTIYMYKADSDLIKNYDGGEIKREWLKKNNPSLSAIIVYPKSTESNVSENENPVTETETNDEWKELYINMINNDIDPMEFSLICIDDDDIPELIFTGSAIAGTRMAWIKNGKVEIQAIGYGKVMYYEKQGLFYCQYVNHGIYMDSVYSFTDKDLNIIFQGTILPEENGFENPGWFINEESVEKEEYEAKLGDVFDFDNAENIYSLIVSRDEIVDYITNY